MKKMLLGLSIFAFAAVFAACGDTTDCLCTYSDGTINTFYDYTGDCSLIDLVDLNKKMTVPGGATGVFCEDM